MAVRQLSSCLFYLPTLRFIPFAENSWDRLDSLEICMRISLDHYLAIQEQHGVQQIGKVVDLLRQILSEMRTIVSQMANTQSFLRDALNGPILWPCLDDRPLNNAAFPNHPSWDLNTPRLAFIFELAKIIESVITKSNSTVHIDCNVEVNPPPALRLCRTLAFMFSLYKTHDGGLHQWTTEYLFWAGVCLPRFVDPAGTIPCNIC